MSSRPVADTATSSSRRGWSIRARLTLVLAIGFAVLVAATSVLTSRQVRDRVTAEADATLLAKARALAVLVEQEAGRIEVDFTSQTLPEFERAQDPEYFELWQDDGRVLARSTRLVGDLPRAAPAADTPVRADMPVVADAVLPDGRAGRVVELRFCPKGPEEPHAGEESRPATARAAAVAAPCSVVLVVARSREPVDQLLARLQLAIFGTGAVTIVVAVVLAGLALAWGLRPLDALASQVAVLDADGLHARVGLPRTPRELELIVAQINALLQRLDASFERERRFAGNVAHELRTPIAELRTLADVAGRWPDDAEAVARFFGDVKGISHRMERVVTDLLLLARCQAGVETCDNAAVDLRRTVASVWSSLQATASARGLASNVLIPDGAVVWSDPAKLRILLGNLLGNAVSHALPDGEILCRVTIGETAVGLEVSNAAEPLTAAELRNVTEPFWRKDTARSSPAHAGLGLAIVAALARVLGLQLAIDQDGGRFRVALTGFALASEPDLAEAPTA